MEEFGEFLPIYDLKIRFEIDGITKLLSMGFFELSHTRTHRPKRAFHPHKCSHTHQSIQLDTVQYSIKYEPCGLELRAERERKNSKIN